MKFADSNYFPKFSNYSMYTSVVNYLDKPNYTSTTVEEWIDRFTHYFYDTLAPNYTLPPGYIVEKDNGTLSLGPKVTNNDWADLLNKNWGFFTVIAFLLALAIIVPFIAVCYCCFCCCKCDKQCPPCDAVQKNALKRCCFGYILILYILVIICGAIICFASNSSVDQAMQRTSSEMSLGTQDTCTYLKDIYKHIHHLLVNNYEELCAHIISVLNGAPQTIYEAYKKNAECEQLWVQSEKINNMPKAVPLMKKLPSLIKELRFISAQLRDGLRTIKRDLTFALTVLCGNSDCHRFLTKWEIETLDSSKCLHFDEMPDPLLFSAAMETIIDKQGALFLLHKIRILNMMLYSNGAGVPKYFQPMINLLTEDVNAGKNIFRLRAVKIRSIIYSVINEIHMTGINASKSFEDVTIFGGTQSVSITIVCLLLSTTIIFLIIGLIFGCCGRHRRGSRDGCCSKRTGAVFMLMAILLIFGVFSFLVLYGVYYLVLGLLTYQSVCAPLRDQEENANDLNQSKPMSKIIKSFQDNQSMCELLESKGFNDVEELSKISFIQNHKMQSGTFSGRNLSGIIKFAVYNKSEHHKFLYGNELTKYNSSEFTKNFCEDVTPVDLLQVANQLIVLQSTMWTQWGIYDWARWAFETNAEDLRMLHNEFVHKVKAIMHNINQTLTQIDETILVNSTYLYGPSVDGIDKRVKECEEYFYDHVHDFYLEQGLRLPGWMKEFVDEYIKHVQNVICTKLGNNFPNESIYNRGEDIVCERLVNPLNRFWVGLFIIILLLLPVLILAHQLMCVYKKIKPRIVVEDGCPTCSG